MSETRSPQTAARPRQPGARCVHCRQMKVKCDVNERFPTPCTRCNRAGRRCHIDPQFKRISKKGLLESIEQEVRELRESLKTPRRQSDHVLPATADPTSPPSAVEFEGLSPQDPTPTLLNLCDQLRDPRNGMLRTIADVELTSGMTADLIERYYSNYHHKFALLSDPNTCIQAYETCPLLFWMVMAIAAKRSDQYSHIYTKLIEPVEALAKNHTSPVNRNILFVQGLLLLSLWSMPFHAVVEDPSWLYCGIATHMAMLLGLHQPQYAFMVLAAGESDKGPLYIRERTWLGCFIINQKLSLQHAIPATMAPDQTVMRAISSSNFLSQNDPFESQLHIAHLSSRANKLLGQQDIDPSGLFSSPIPLIHMLDSDLNLLHTRYSDIWAPATEISFLYTRLNLYSYGLTRRRQQPSVLASDADDEAQLLVFGSRAAMRLLFLATDAPDEITHGTNYTQSSVVYAVLFLIHITKTRAKSLIDLAAAGNTIRDTWKLLKDLSQDPEDHFARVCEIIEYMSRPDVVWDEAADPATNNTRNWMGKNFVVDVVVRARERFGKPGYREGPKVRSRGGTAGAEAQALGVGIGLGMDLAANMGVGADGMNGMGFVDFGWGDESMIMGVPDFGNSFGYGFP